MSMATVEIEKDSVRILISFHQMIATELGLCGLHMEINCHQAIFAWNIVSKSNKWITMCINFPKQSNKCAQYVWRVSNNFHCLFIFVCKFFVGSANFEKFITVKNFSIYGSLRFAGLSIVVHLEFHNSAIYVILFEKNLYYLYNCVTKILE